MNRIYAFCGFAGSGKDTAANFMVEEYGFKKVSFADTLKDCVSAVFGWDRKLLQGDTEESRIFREKEDLYWSTKMGKHITPRIVLQQVGTEVWRNFHGNIWIDSLMKRINDDTSSKYVISDLRFYNEFLALKSAGAKIIKVNRQTPHWYRDAKDFLNSTSNKKYSYPLSDFMLRSYPMVHSSEYELLTFEDEADVKLNNFGTIDFLYSRMNGI